MLRIAAWTASTVLVALAVSGPGHAASDPTGGIAGLVRRAERGDPQAQTRLGFLYQIGRGVPQNYVEAARWQTRAACQGEPRAQYLLGLLYDKGHGVPQDYVQAYMWLSLATASAPPGQAEISARIRDAVATKLSPIALAQAQFLAASFRPRREGF
ncbi:MULTISPECIES: tetratricopeptide repeat protein [Rhodoplanes]|nr:tetratricopeptide repeat protein [Rhodoplanes serenus]